MSKKIYLYILGFIVIVVAVSSYAIFDYIYVAKLVGIERCLETSIGPKNTWIETDTIPKERIMYCGLKPNPNGMGFHSDSVTRNYFFTGEELRIGVIVFSEGGKFQLIWNRDTSYLWKRYIVERQDYLESIASSSKIIEKSKSLFHR